MSNKIALATIQFRADAKGANVALESLRSSADNARRTVNEMQAALDKGIKTMKDSTGVEFNVADRLRAATKEAKGFESAIHELMKGATALEEVVRNIRLGEIEKSSRAELKGAINAAESRKRSVRGSDEDSLKMQRELNIVIEESRKQLNNLDRDTQKVIDTLKNGGTVAESVLNKEQKGLQEILSLIPKGTEEYKQYAAQLKEIKTLVANIKQQEQIKATSLLGDQNLGKYTEEQIRAAIDAGKLLIQTYKTASPEAKALADNIARAEQHLKNYGIEAARAAAKEAEQIKTQEQAEKQLRITMNGRLRELPKLSAEALAETKKYWEAQKAGAAMGSAELAKYETNLKKIANQEEKRRRAQLDNVLTQPGQYGVAEVKAATQEMEKLRDSVKQGSAAWLHYNKMVEQGKAYLDGLALQKVETQMQNLSTLSAAGLAEVKKYWEAQVSGAALGSRELDEYKVKLEQVTAEEQRRTQLQAQQRVGVLSSGNLGQYTETQIRQAIEAGQQLIKTYATGSTEAQELAQKIVAAEQHLRQYGVEAERTAAKEAEAVRKAAEERAKNDALMKEQLQKQGALLSESALKQQQQYWQRLIDDPKTAASSLQEYKRNLLDVQRAQQAQTQIKGQEALTFFRGDTSNASAAQIKEQADALKKYRDSLPQQTNASIIQEIDGYLAKTGKTAEKATQEMIELSKAMSVSANSGKSAFGISKQNMEQLDFLKEQKRLLEEQMASVAKGSFTWQELNRELAEVNAQMQRLPFAGTTEDLQKAQKAIEQALATTDKGTPKYERLRMALSRIKAEMAGAGISAQKTQEVLANPKAEKSMDVLKAAIARARAEMDVMGQRAERLRYLIEQASGSETSRHRLESLQKELRKTEADMAQLTKGTKECDFAQKQLANTSKGAASSFEKAWSRLKTYITLYVGAAVAIQKITASLGDLMELSDKMGEVQKTTNLNAEAVGRLSEKLKALDVRTPLADLMAVSASAGQLGLKTEEDIMGFTEAANKMMIALPEMGKEAATEMMRVAIATGEVDKIRKEMSQGLIEGSSATAVAMEKIASTVDRLRASSASTAPEITDFVKRVGAVGAQSGISIDQVAALGSTISSLGMRVEMSATALSRMIPAIKNNAFSVAKAIGVTPETLRNLFETGRGMEAILLIFQHLKDAGKDADSIEKMLGLGGMQDVMKQLNQQGARAGIVFAGLSQNVDELRKQLGVANQAYEENIAIQREFDRMNDTAAAKWERLKNQFEEFFIGDASQRFMGGLIDTLRGFVDVLTGNVGPALQTVTVLIHTFLAYWGALKLGLGEAIFVKAWEGLKNLGTTLSGLTTTTQRTIVYTKLLAKANEELAVATTAVAQAETRQKVAAIEARMAQEGLNKAMVANIWMAVAVAVGALVLQVVRWIDAANEAGKEAAKFESELIREQIQVDNLTESIGKARAKIDETNKDVEKAQKAFNEAKKSLDGTRESTDRLTKAETELIEKQEAQRKALAEHKRMIEQFNTEYGKYLGFMLSEVSSNIELAQARELVNDKLRETITLKKREAAITRVENKYGEDRDDAYASLLGAARYASTSKDNTGKMVQDPTKAAKVMNAITKAANNDKLSREQFEKTITSFFKENKVGYRGTSLLSKALDYFDEVKKVREKTNDVLEQYKGEDKANREQSQKGLERQYTAAVGTYLDLQRKYVKATGDARKQAAADMLKQMDSINEMVDNSSNYFDMTEEDEKRSYNTFIKNGDARLKGMNAQREKLLKEAGNAYQSRKKVGGGETSSIKTNPWGGSHEAESIDWKNMNADQLVARRKQMNEFVKAIQTDSDVQSVLKEDAALKKAIEKGMSSDMRTVIEWYNTERLKIQDELHARHLTNTGDWQDPKKQAARKKQFTDEMKAYLEELDAYYTERNQKIQNARNDEEITEGEAWRQTIENESEWHQRRAELQKMYSNKSAEVVKDEQDAIHSIIAKRTGDDVAYIEKSIQKTKQFAEQVRKADPRGEDEYRKWQADLGLGWEKDFMQQAKAIGKQVKFMTDTLAKERPFNGITENLELNLTKMGILVGNVPDKMHFLLGQIEDAYTLDVKQMVDRVAQAGFTEWAKQLQGDVSMQQAMLAQLRTAYEAVQEAIRKEGARIKKDADMMWKLALTPDGKNLKQEIDAAMVNMTQQQEAVSRANSLIGAGTASENVASRVAIKQMQLQLSVQQAQFALMRKMGDEKAQYLDQLAEQYEKENKLKEAERARLDAENVRKSLDIAITEEKKKQAEITKHIAKEQEEIQNRLYKDLRELSGLLTKGLQGVFEAVNFYNSSDYNNLAVTRAGGSYNKNTTKTTSYSTSSKVTDTGKHSTSTSASSTSTKTNKTDSSDASQASKSSYSDTNRDQSVNRSATSDTHSTTNTSQSKTSTTTTEKIQSYYIIDNAGTKDAVAREVEMSEEEYYEKKIELDRDNAIKEAWKNLLDELNMKMSETITDQINAMFQQEAIDTNTAALRLNTDALTGLTAALGASPETRNQKPETGDWARDAQGMALDDSGNIVYPIHPTETESAKPLFPTSAEDWEKTREQMGETFQFAGEKMIETNEMLNEAGVKPLFPQPMTDDEVTKTIDNYGLIQDSMAEKVIETGQMVQDAGVQPLTPQMMSDEEVQAQIDQANTLAQGKIDAQNAVAANKVNTDQQQVKSETSTDQQMTTSANSMYAKMIQAANLYGIAYQAMSNDNLNTAQKFEMIAVQAAGQAAISALTASMSQNAAQVAADTPAVASKTFAQLGPIGGPAAFAAITALLGGLLGVAVSKIAKSKQEIAQATGVSASGTNVSAGKLMTGMLTYGEGNVNEFTDPSSLTPGRSYNVDSADGRTYRARYMGADPKTHLTNGPEFHLVGERGREAIIDAHTTRLMQMDDTGIWQAIQTLYNGGSLRHSVMRRKGRGMAAFADGNIDEFETTADGGGLMAGGAGLSPEQMMALQASIDRQSDLLERAMTDGIHAYFDVYGRGGLIDSYDTGKKTVNSHGERY